MNHFYTVSSYAEGTYFLKPFYENCIWNKIDMLVYDNYENIDINLDYKCELLRLPYKIRKRIIKNGYITTFEKKSVEIFNAYAEICRMINVFLSNKHNNVFLMQSIFFGDYCLLSHNKQKNLVQIKKEIIDFLCFIFLTDDNDNVEAVEIIQNKNKRLRCINSDRQFVKHNPMFNYYNEQIHRLENIKCDSIDRKQELSLFSSLVLKDLVEETHSYWVYDSGDLKYESAEIAYILRKQNESYFSFFNLFCEQAEDESKYNDWEWTLIFLTQSLLHAVNESPRITNKQNFYGFIPIIKDIREKHNEVTSLFSRHISREFCHGFLIVPTGSIFNIIENFPAYIHEFFHYIPPFNRPKRNEAIFDLVFHSVFFELRKNVDKEAYYSFFKQFKKQFLKLPQNSVYKNDLNSFFDCDSMEYIERLKPLFLTIDLNDIYYSTLVNTKFEVNVVNFTKLLKYRQDCVKRFKTSAIDYLNIFTLFFREIRSDIAMCTFLDIGLSDYIRILAKEPLFAKMNKVDCGDSSILRLGFMCNYLYQTNKENNFRLSTKWIPKCKDIIVNQMNAISKEDDKFFDDISERYKNMIGYIEEFDMMAFEKNANCFLEKDGSLLSIIEEDYGILSDWKSDFDSICSHKFVYMLKNFYKDYLSRSFEDRLITICGAKSLFRDLYSYDVESCGII